MVVVKGGTRRQRNVAENVACFCWLELMPRIRKCVVNIEIQKLEGYEGWCLDTDEREYKIAINRKLDWSNFIKTICHEMVHVKQFVRKELYSECNFYDSYEEYLNVPWEKEAYRMQEELYKKWLIGTTMNPRKLKLSVEQ